MNKCSPCSISIQSSWILYIQQHGGSKVAVDVPTNGLTPVANLRQLIKDELSVETYQQRLTTVGGEILEDYDDDGRCLLLCNYPAMYDGATLYLVRLTGGMYVEHKREQHVSIDKVSKQNLCYPLSEKEIDLHQHINITDPNTFTIKKLAKIMNTRKKLCTNIYEYHVYGRHFNASWGVLRLFWPHACISYIIYLYKALVHTQPVHYFGVSFLHPSWRAKPAS